MTPRADTLYKGIEKLDYLFPFPDVKRGSRVLIYGMGIYGQRLYRYLERTGFCNLVAAFDRNYAELEKQGVHVLPPREISDYEYDHIVIACMDKKAGEGIYGELVKAYPEEKIHAVDYELIRSDGALKAFGLLL
jgi:hypothetical protein